MLPVPYIARRTWTVFLIFQALLNCIKADCGPPPVIEHTLPVAETSGVPGTAVVYRCDRNNGYYELPGKSRTIMCLDDNTWSSVSDFCARACDLPERINFAVPRDSDLEKDIFLPGTKVNYDCVEGYKRKPFTTNYVTCLDNYTWSTTSEFCEPKSCGHPGDLSNGDFNATNNFLFGSRVEYFCNEGYRLENRRNYRDCLANGQWSNSVPVCEVVICSAPNTPAHGRYTPEKDEYNYLDAVTFSCNNDLKVNGSRSASCTKDGTWSEETPTCIVVSCQDPGQIPNAKRLSGFGGSYSLNSAVRFECQPGFVMKGSSSIICNINSRWEPDIPQCLSTCGAPPLSYFAVLEEDSASHIYVDGTTLHYKCKPGYERNPSINNSITCVGRSWSALAEFCSPISCGDPGEVIHAERSNSQFTFGSKIFYTCEQGYEMMTLTNFRECRANGTWSNGEIICSVVCQRPTVPNSRFFAIKRVYFPNEVVTVLCDKGFVLSGSSSITCSSVGQWEPSPPRCNVTCQLPEVANAEVKLGFKKGEYLENDILEFECKNGYTISGSSAIKCSSEGHWRPHPPECKYYPIPLIIGIVVGVCLTAAIAFGLWWYKTKSKSGKSLSDAANVQYTACNNARDKGDATA
ncbi:C4b-binding protein alpha chain-like isoform X2 [Engystomops pustulosus]|uniref:C4b-binding protein alpha chain-like isoform X2 n=1 Tax=Engystomops pustulosus TaxID=76066 RepID=UPI003AFA16E8